jgi:hypothetical protein
MSKKLNSRNLERRKILIIVITVQDKDAKRLKATQIVIKSIFALLLIKTQTSLMGIALI